MMRAKEVDMADKREKTREQMIVQLTKSKE
jgi:hypothetical protein